MEQFSVNQLAKLAGVSVRTLHHYDQIGLLKPARRSDSNYRYYGKTELLRLQQILLYRELDFPLERIADILDDSSFDMLAALQLHKNELQKRKERMNRLLLTIDNTIHQLKKETEKMDYNELYKGFDPKEAEAYEKEAAERWGAEKMEASKAHLLSLSKAEWDALKEEGEALNREFAAHMHLSPESPEVQALVARHYRLITRMNPDSVNYYRQLGEMYAGNAADERFKGYYDKYAPGMAEFLKAGMDYFCEHTDLPTGA